MDGKSKKVHDIAPHSTNGLPEGDENLSIFLQSYTRAIMSTYAALIFLSQNYLSERRLGAVGLSPVVSKEHGAFTAFFYHIANACTQQQHAEEIRRLWGILSESHSFHVQLQIEVANVRRRNGVLANIYRNMQIFFKQWHVLNASVRQGFPFEANETWKKDNTAKFTEMLMTLDFERALHDTERLRLLRVMFSIEVFGKMMGLMDSLNKRTRELCMPDTTPDQAVSCMSSMEEHLNSIEVQVLETMGSDAEFRSSAGFSSWGVVPTQEVETRQIVKTAFGHLHASVIPNMQHLQRWGWGGKTAVHAGYFTAVFRFLVVGSCFVGMPQVRCVFAVFLLCLEIVH